MPALPQDVREFGYLDEPVVSVAGFERVDPDRPVAVGRFDDNQPVVEILLDNVFLIGNRAKQKGRRIAVQVEKHEPTVRLDILPRKGP